MVVGMGRKQHLSGQLSHSSDTEREEEEEKEEEMPAEERRELHENRLQWYNIKQNGH